MALTTAELRRIRFELGYNVLDAGAEPYIGTHAVFEQVIAAYMQGGASTTSSTAVTAATSPTPVTLTLASGTGFTAGDVVIVDVDTRQERVTAQTVSGASLTVQLSLAHSGTYPVTVEGGEAIVRSILRRLYDVGDKIGSSASSSGIKSVGRGAIEWYGDGGTTVLSSLKKTQQYWRDELASALGVVNLHRMRAGAGGMSLY